MFFFNFALRINLFCHFCDMSRKTFNEKKKHLRKNLILMDKINSVSVSGDECLLVLANM